MDQSAAMSPDRSIPGPALLLGWLGVLPFAAACLAAVAGSTETAALASRALVVYATIILSFMGGAQWGLAIVAQVSDAATLLRRLAVSTLPALAAFALAAVPPRMAMVGLAVVFVALLAYDIATAREGIAPRWYPALRAQLTAAVVLCLLAGAGLGRA